MTTVSDLRIARLRKGLTLDEIFLLTNGELTPARLSRVERGLAKPTRREIALIEQVIGVGEEVVGAATLVARSLIPAPVGT
jgi:transcriptional regulator with XRE-family HTH domain